MMSRYREWWLILLTIPATFMPKLKAKIIKEVKENRDERIRLLREQYRKPAPWHSEKTNNE